VLLLWRVEVSLVLRVGTAVTLNIGSNRTRGVARSATTSRGRYENARRALGAPVLVSGAFVLAACTNSAGSVSVRGDAGTSTEAGKSAGIPGYVHTLARSRFVIGKITGETDEFGMHKIIGDDGVFATEIVSQGVTAIPDFEVPSPTGQYFPGGYVAQNAEVVSYLTGAGLPADQILSVTDDETGVSRWSGGDSGDIFDPKNVVVVTWFTVFHRGYEGVPIEDSTGWAILGSHGESLEEKVFWPAIGQDVVTELEAFQAVLSDPNTQAAFLARLPSGLSGGHLAIHHTLLEWQGPFEAHPCYRGVLGGTSLCFDLSGNLLQLADETNGNVTPDASATGSAATPDASALVCPESSSRVPSGACTGAGSCVVEVQVTCGDATSGYIPESPPVYQCNCPSGTWQCTQVPGGGFGVISCGSAP
jgi:hypothetical protein